MFNVAASCRKSPRTIVVLNSVTPSERGWLARLRSSAIGRAYARVVWRLHRLRSALEVRDQRVEIRDVDRLRRDRLAGESEAAAAGQHEVVDHDGVGRRVVERFAVGKRD